MFVSSPGPLGRLLRFGEASGLKRGPKMEENTMARMNGNRTQNRNQRTADRDSAEQPNGRTYKEIFGVVDRGEQSFWTRIGVAFQNSDGSLNCLFNFLPTDPQTTIQIREPRPRDE
jgi:hypothetical protein